MKQSKYSITAKVWLYPGDKASWHFITIPKKESKEITEKYKPLKKGWGSLPVAVTIRKTTWNTSVFPDSKSGTYLLPLKALIRRKEGLESGDKVSIVITIKT